MKAKAQGYKRALEAAMMKPKKRSHKADSVEDLDEQTKSTRSLIQKSTKGRLLIPTTETSVYHWHKGGGR